MSRRDQIGSQSDRFTIRVRGQIVFAGELVTFPDYHKRDVREPTSLARVDRRRVADGGMTSHLQIVNKHVRCYGAAMSEVDAARLTSRVCLYGTVICSRWLQRPISSLLKGTHCTFLSVATPCVPRQERRERRRS